MNLSNHVWSNQNTLWRAVLLVTAGLGIAGGCTSEASPVCPPDGAAVRASEAASVSWIEVNDEGDGFISRPCGKTFVSWGFNYDHDEAGRLLEAYWTSEWDKVVEDFQEMKALGANTVRIHLQFGAFMRHASEPDPSALGRLEKLVDLAEAEGLRLNLTGLGCYLKEEVPAWYESLSEEERWAAQACFWGAVTRRCAGRPGVFCYDLMNEPVVPGGRREPGAWLGPAFAEKYHYVQFITLDARGRSRSEVARAWIRRLTSAIREHDQRTPITVGLVPWSLDQPGLTSGFVPEVIAPELDFVSVHLYPESGKLEEALATLQGFVDGSAGKPVVIEEMFPLRCSAAELGEFIARSQGLASGYVGFYWGKTLDECRQSGTLADAIMAAWLELFADKRF